MTRCWVRPPRPRRDAQTVAAGHCWAASRSLPGRSFQDGQHEDAQGHQQQAQLGLADDLGWPAKKNINKNHSIRISVLENAGTEPSESILQLKICGLQFSDEVRTSANPYVKIRRHPHQMITDPAATVAAATCHGRPQDPAESPTWKKKVGGPGGCVWK